MKEKKFEMDSINQELCDDLFVQKLEERLETDPLAANGLIDLLSTDNAISPRGWCIWGNVCVGENG